MTNRGDGNPILDMVFEPRFRMGPPPRSFAADAHDCIMVPIPTDQPNTSLWREVCADGELPSVSSQNPARKGRPSRSNKSAAMLVAIKGKALPMAFGHLGASA
jgi:hypothetical protein